MTNAEALEVVNRAGTSQQIRVTGHGGERMLQRGVRMADVYNAAMTATSAKWQSEKETWKVQGGLDIDDDELDLVVAIEADVVLVSVY